MKCQNSGRNLFKSCFHFIQFSCGVFTEICKFTKNVLLKLFSAKLFNYTFWPIPYFYRLLWYFTSQILMWGVTSWMTVEKSPFSLLVALKSAVPNLEDRHVTRSSTAFLPLKGKWSIAALVSCQVQIQVLGNVYYIQTLLWRLWSSQPLVL